MKNIIYLVALISICFLGEWVYRSFVRPIDPLTSELRVVETHFIESGIKVRAYPVRHGYNHSELTAVAGFQITNFPLPIVVDECPSVELAELHFQRIKGSPNLTHPARNGRFVMNLPMWGDDTGEMARKVNDAFMSLKTSNL